MREEQQQRVLSSAAWQYHRVFEKLLTDRASIFHRSILFVPTANALGHGIAVVMLGYINKIKLNIYYLGKLELQCGFKTIVLL